MARLVLTCDGVDLITYELVGDVITIGSAPLNHVVIDNPAVSAQHAILARVVDSYRLKDLNSTNGTQVNVPPDARPISKLKRRAPRKHVLSRIVLRKRRNEVSKRLNRKHARQPCLEQKQATDALSSPGNQLRFQNAE